MNMLYEGLREKGALVIVPSSAVNSMNLGGIAGFTGLATMHQMLMNDDDGPKISSTGPTPAVPQTASQPSELDPLPNSGS